MNKPLLRVTDLQTEFTTSRGVVKAEPPRVSWRLVGLSQTSTVEA